MPNATGVIAMPLDRRNLLGLAAIAAASPALADPGDPGEVANLWPGPPPGAPTAVPRETIVNRIATSGFQDRFVTGIGTPLMTVFRPPGE